MRMFTMQSDKFAVLKKRFTDWEASGFQDSDEPITGILSKINQIEGLVPVWSCSAHPGERNRRQLYIVVVVEEGRIETLYSMFERMQNSYDQSGFNPMMTKLSFSVRKRPSVLTRDVENYFAWCIDVSPIDTVERQAEVIEMLEKSFY